MTKIYAVDIDLTICISEEADYEKATPLMNRINRINQLFDEGNIIHYFTARGSSTGIDWKSTTLRQLEEWGAKYHYLSFGKPHAHHFIDDKAINSELFFCESHNDLLVRELLSFSKLLAELASDPGIGSTFKMIVSACTKTIRAGGKIILAGNGGSLSDAQHLCAEFVSKINLDRPPISAICLGLNASTITAISNDYSYGLSLAREFIALYRPEDTLLVFSTSGESDNILELVSEANRLKCPTYGLTGKSKSNSLTNLCNCLHISSDSTSMIQQAHITLSHSLCYEIEKELGMVP